jgi:hypothetical protein
VPVSGNVIFMPWVTLPAGLRVGRFRFCPVDTKSLGSVVDSDIAQTLTHLLKGYVRRNGESIDSCTIVLRLRAAQAWNIPERMWTDVSRAAEILCLGCLAEQRFLEGHFSPHLNASMFRRNFTRPAVLGRTEVLAPTSAETGRTGSTWSSPRSPIPLQ